MTYNDISIDTLYDAMLEALTTGMAAGFSGSKSIDGMSPEEWVDNYISENLDLDDDEEDD